jgi:carboxyl-terminal processing protease
MRSLIIDVRGNPGGLLSAAVEVADRFLGNGRIVTTRGRNVRENFDYMAHRANTWNVPLAVLVDHDSASASEIFAGAIADSGRGVLVGETSYGKGSVQGIFRMQSAKFGLCLTTAKFFSPSGRAISQNGVVPTIEVEPTYIAARPDSEGKMTLDRDDAVMQKAIEQFIIGDKISRRP